MDRDGVGKYLKYVDEPTEGTLTTARGAVVAAEKERLHEKLKNKFVLIQQKTRYKVEGRGTFECTTKTIVNPLSMRELTAPGHVMDVGRIIAEESEQLRRQDRRMAREIRQAEKYQMMERDEKEKRL